MARKKQKATAVDLGAQAFQEGYERVSKHPMLGHVLAHSSVWRGDMSNCPKDAWGVVSKSGVIHLHRSKRAEASEWVYVLAHCLLHLGFNHFEVKQNPAAWQAACDVVVANFLDQLKIGERPVAWGEPLPSGSVDSLYRTFCQTGIPPHVAELATIAKMIDFEEVDHPFRRKVEFSKVLAIGISNSVNDALETVSGTRRLAEERHDSCAQRARRWFVSKYPLLGALASAFKIIERAEVCQRLDIWVAAVDAHSGEVFMNPAANLDEMECRFVMAHELLHVGLRHMERRQGRDPWLWNVACDFVINAWLAEMKVGTAPEIGMLYDPQFKDLSAEEVYDRITTDLRHYRKLASLRGIDMGDMLGDPFRRSGPHADLEDFYRRALCQGLELHERAGRGLLPAGLVEEIKALSQPPIPWEVELANWLDGFFRPIEYQRTYARLSRRQSATPDIPRPRTMPMEESYLERTFGVLLDTSGSMSSQDLGKALGAIASYAASRDVKLVRVVFCDAISYDEGYMSPEDIAGRVRIRGRGGTVLQPGIELIERASDFPDKGPILVITDGWCDRLTVRRDHAYLMPVGRSLPFVPKGPIFRMD